MSRPALPDPAPSGPLYDGDAAAEYLHVSPRMVRRLTESRRLAYVKVGRHVRFRQADLDSYIAAQAVEASA